MIPDVMVDFLARASVAVASTRDDRLVPAIHFLSGWYVDPGHREVVCLFSPSLAEGVVERLERHGEFALAAEVIGPHECYQFKGRYVDARPVADADRAVFEACRARFVEAVKRLFGARFGDDALRARFRDPSVAVRFQVHEIFVQTPGPSAGTRVFPVEGA